MKTLCALIAPAVALLLFAQSIFAASVAGAGVKIDGKYIGGYAITWSGQSPMSLLGQLVNEPLIFERDFKIPVDAGNPDKAILTGGIKVVASVRNDDKVVAEMKTLTLVKRKGEWYVDEDDVKRALKLAQKP